MNDDFAVLRDILARHGFGQAALRLQSRDLGNIRDTLRTWEGYPKKMEEQYPNHLQVNRREPTRRR